MRNDDNKKSELSEDKKESELVTKESFSAVCALFSLIAFLILCTKSFIFGDFGDAVHAFLTGAFGYFAYPLFLGGIYFFSMALIGKRLIKNRKVGLCVILGIVFAGLILHTALTYSWPLDGYLSACFDKGKNFPSSTITGWFGGLFVFVFASAFSKTGAIVCFAIFAVISVYLAVIFARKSTKKAPKKEEKKYEIPVTQLASELPTKSEEAHVTPPSTPNYQAPTNAYVAQVQQRPGVRLNEREEQPPVGGAFSPFGTPQTMQEKDSAWLEKSYDNSREYLFGTTPAENYKKNLIFDPNSSANRRPPVDPYQPAVQSGFTPSYSDAYATSVDNHEDIAPMKIVTDATYGYRSEDYDREPTATETRQEPSYFGNYGGGEETIPTQPAQPPENKIPDIQPLPTYEPESTFLHTDEPSRTQSLFGERDAFRPAETHVEEDRTERFAEDREEPVVPERSDRADSAYRRHDYMELFSTENPNIFGNEDRDTVLSGENSGRSDERESRWGSSNWESGPTPFDNAERDSIVERNSDRNEENARNEHNERDALRLFDETPEDDPYSLRSDFEEPTSDRADFDLDAGSSFYNRDGEYSSNRADRRTGFAEEETSRGIENDFYSPRNEFVEPPRIQEPPKPKKPHIPKPYVCMSLDDLDCRDIEPTANQAEVEETKETIIAILEDFKVTGATIASVTFGPTVTRYNVTLPRSVSPKKVVALDQSIAIGLHANGVNIYPNYEDGVVSIEVPNKKRQFVQLGCMLSGDTYVNAKPSSLMFAMGKDVANRKVYGDISKMIHLLVAGASGSGKSVFLGALIISLIQKYSPEELRLILIDPKKTEFVLYNDLPHLMINEIITDVGKAVQSLNWAIEEMNRRYGLFQEMTRNGAYVVNLEQYNAQVKKHERLPKIVIIIDELADLMLAAKKDIEDRIQNLTQKARAAGIHMIVATQRPSTDVITGVIKSNLPTRVAFGVATDVDSRVILDQGGAQKLLGKGDFLYTMQGINTPVRVQSAFISPEESLKVVNFIKEHNEAYYDEEATAYINNTKASSGGGGGNVGEKDIEPVYIEALKYVILSGSASISMIQRKCSAGYNKAGRIIEWMEEMGYISAFDGAKARKVLITQEEFEAKYGPM